MIAQAIAWLWAQDSQVDCVLIGLGCYALIPFFLSLERTAAINRIADAIKGLGSRLK